MKTQEVTPAEEVRKPKDWLDIEIHAPPNFEQLRWKWLGALVMVGSIIPYPVMGKEPWVGIEVAVLALVGVFVWLGWQTSSLMAKAGLAFVAGLSVFLHQTLPIPGIGYGCFHWYVHETIPVQWSWNPWLLLFEILGVAFPVIILIVVHSTWLATEYVVVRLGAMWRNLWAGLSKRTWLSRRSADVRKVDNRNLSHSSVAL